MNGRAAERARARALPARHGLRAGRKPTRRSSRSSKAGAGRGRPRSDRIGSDGVASTPASPVTGTGSVYEQASGDARCGAARSPRCQAGSRTSPTAPTRATAAWSGSAQAALRRCGGHSAPQEAFWGFSSAGLRVGSGFCAVRGSCCLPCLVQQQSVDCDPPHGCLAEGRSVRGEGRYLPACVANPVHPSPPSKRRSESWKGAAGAQLLCGATPRGGSLQAVAPRYAQCLPVASACADSVALGLIASGVSELGVQSRRRPPPGVCGVNNGAKQLARGCVRGAQCIRAPAFCLPDDTPIYGLALLPTSSLNSFSRTLLESW
eukprot:scaffold1399_cov410-Prasinococcus_capsulatus_cf.AAC.39